MFSMQPQRDDTTINIPLTFDYNGGRSENNKHKIVTTIIVVSLSLLLTVAVIFGTSASLLTKIIVTAVIFLVSSTFIRFSVLSEGAYSAVYERLIKIDYTPEASSFWKIYDISKTYPYVCHYINGYKAIFVQMEKDVIVGKSEYVSYDHCEGISDAYNLAASLNISFYHVDYMDSVGNDPRLANLYTNLKKVNNPDMKDVLIDIYGNLEDEMSRNFSCFDTYVFYTKDTVENLIYNVQSLCGAMLGGNYLTYKILNMSDLRLFCMALLNLKEFSVLDACSLVLKNLSHTGIVPISIRHIDGTEEKINKTVNEKRIEYEEKIRREKEEKANKALRKKKSGKKENTSNDDLNLFQ